MAQSNAIIRQPYAVASAYVATNVTVTSAPTLVSSLNTARNHIMLQDITSGKDVYVAYASTMTYPVGERITQWGKWERSAAQNVMYYGTVYAVTSAGTATLVVHESSDVTF